MGDQKGRKSFIASQLIDLKEELLLGSAVVSNHFSLAHMNDAMIFQKCVALCAICTLITFFLKCLVCTKEIVSVS